MELERLGKPNYFLALIYIIGLYPKTHSIVPHVDGLLDDSGISTGVCWKGTVELE